MKKCWFLPLLATLFLGACASVPQKGRIDYAAPSTTAVRQNVKTAQDRLVSARSHIRKSNAATVAAAVKAKTVKARLLVLAKATTADPTTHALVLQVTDDVDGLTNQLLLAEGENANLTIDVQASQTALILAQSKTVDLQNQVDKQTLDLNESNRIRNEAIDARDAANAHVHKLKFWICTLAAAAALLLVTRFTGFLAPLLGPYAFILYIAAPAAVFGFLWLRL